MAEKKLKAIADKVTQTQIISQVAESTGLTRKQIVAVFEATSELSHRHIMQRGSGEFKVPYIGIKIVRKTKPATKKRDGINPATGAKIVIPAKPKREVVKVVALKALKAVLET